MNCYQLGIVVTPFVGEDKLKHETFVLGLLVDKEPIKEVKQGQEVEIILSETPFYGEMGGQVGDIGEIKGLKGKVTVSDTVRPLFDLIVHKGKVAEGVISVDDSVEAEVDSVRRLDIARNHTATHLLQAALRKVLGDQVRQAGSLVAPGHLRFDFTHYIALSREELQQIQPRLMRTFARTFRSAAKLYPMIKR